jgi:hypothetical protein
MGGTDVKVSPAIEKIFIRPIKSDPTDKGTCCGHVYTDTRGPAISDSQVAGHLDRLGPLSKGLAVQLL